MPRLLAAPMLVLVLVAAGCGEAGTNADFSGEEQKVADALTDLQTYARDGDADRVCRELLAAAVTKQLGGDCARQVDASFEDADSLQVNVDSVRVTGQTARARVTSGRDDQKKELYELVRESGRWKIAKISPVRS